MSSPASEDKREAFGLGRKVAVVGAGISGVCAAAHLIKQGLQVTVFERSSIAGGVWHYDRRVAEDPPYPNSVPSRGDYLLSKPGEFAFATPPPEHDTAAGDTADLRSRSLLPADLEAHFSPPGPCYAGLKNNVPTHLMASSLEPWPEGTEPFVSQDKVEQYIQGLASDHGVTAVTSFHTRVDEIRKTPDGTKWEIRSVALEACDTGPRLNERTSYFDLVVVATGHYNMPRIPDTEGLKEWKERYPSRIIHSKQYRSPEPFRGRNILVIGAGVSALDICRETDGVTAKTYQSVRGGRFDLPQSLLPESTVRVPEVARYELRADSGGQLDDEAPIPGCVVLKDGQVLEGIIHHVVVATGYITSYPFLPHLHSDYTPNEQAGEDIVVAAEGDMAHNLHRDIFYINDPTLAFVGVPYHVATFSLFDFQAQAVARVFAGKARLPSREEMRREYQKRVEEKGLGRGFHSLHARGHELEYVQGLVDWEWKRAYNEMKDKTMSLFKGSENASEEGPKENEHGIITRYLPNAQ
ncbi:uncharacterized protein P884DRAFT_274495 [Thermothelomyces heterothallicus CBS 202.75]|uniref:uncharacterized protein n=1 Tax=Thermothelomyces heterothallicus CBS 202.75 TaxID=1149848 RepID=UPI0037423710